MVKADFGFLRASSWLPSHTSHCPDDAPWTSCMASKGPGRQGFWADFERASPWLPSHTNQCPDDAPWTFCVLSRGLNGLVSEHQLSKKVNIHSFYGTPRDQGTRWSGPPARAREKALRNMGLIANFEFCMFTNGVSNNFQDDGLWIRTNSCSYKSGKI